MIWLRPVVLIPVILLRVVWGREVTMETFSPRILLRRVDFPTFGLPIIATYPERKSLAVPSPVTSHSSLKSRDRSPYPLHPLFQVLHGGCVGQSDMAVIAKSITGNEGDIRVLEEI